MNVECLNLASYVHWGRLGVVLDFMELEQSDPENLEYQSSGRAGVVRST